MKDRRIGWLDGLRAIAVTAVMLFHLTSPFTAQYPHTDFFLYVSRYGYLGVQLFFIISGFVISYTLERTPGFWHFHINRFARLFPAMLLCSMLTLGIIRWLDQPVVFTNAHAFRNLLPGLTFTNPHLWAMLTGTEFHWINGSYWTLWVEVQFYLLASVVYYAGKQHFFRKLVLSCIALSGLKYLPGYALNNYPDALSHLGLAAFFRGWNYVDELFNLCFFVGWFLLGALFYRLYKMGWSWLFSITFLLVLACLVRDNFYYFPTITWPLCTGLAIFCSLFFWMILCKRALVFPGSAFFRRIGMISYGIYLIHEEVGLLLIDHFSVLLGRLSFLAPFVVIVLVTCFAELSYRWYEQRFTRLLKRLFKRSFPINESVL